MSLNLLPSQAKFKMEIIKAQVLSKKILIFFLIIWIVVVVVLFATNYGVTQWLQKQNTLYQTAVADYLSSSSDILVSQTIKFRAKLLGTVLSDRFEYANAFNTVGKIFDSSIKIKDFELKDRSYFLMSVVAGNAESMKYLETRVAEINSGSDLGIKNIILKSAVYDKSVSEWLVSMEVYI